MMMMNQSLSSSRSLQQQGDLNWVLENSSSWNNSAMSSNSGLSSSRAPPVARNLMSSSHNAAVGYLDYTPDTGLTPSSQNNLLLNPLAVSDHHPAAANDHQSKPYISPNHWLLLNGSANTSSMATYYTSASRPVFYNSTANYNSIPSSNSASLMEAQQFQHTNYHSAGYPASLSFEHQTMPGEISNKRDSSYGDGFYGRIGLDLGGRTYFSTAEDMLAVRLGKRPRAGSPLPVPMCQAQGCRADLSTAKHYHRRHKVCEMHSKASTVTANGQTQRFCQQCSRFHALSEFDEGKRSCRKRLADHNRRRRKPQPNVAGPSSSSTPAREESSSPPKEGDSGGEDSSKPHNSSSSSAGKEAHNNTPLDLTLI